MGLESGAVIKRLAVGLAAAIAAGAAPGQALGHAAHPQTRQAVDPSAMVAAPHHAHPKSHKKSPKKHRTAAKPPKRKPPKAGSGHKAPATVFGFNNWTTAANAAEQAALGAPIRRIIVSWSSVEPAPGTWDWQTFDQEYEAALGAGLKPLITLFAAPCWARPSTCGDVASTGPADPAFDADWSEFVTRAVQRYPKAVGIEVWSEENLNQYWAPQVNPTRYAQVLKEAFTAVKAVNPKLPVIGGGLVSSPTAGSGPAGTGDQSFLAGVYAAGGGADMDAVGVHPYPYDYQANGSVSWNPAEMTTYLQQLRRVQTAAGFAKQPIWITEVGESTATQPGFPPAVSLAQQSLDITAMAHAASTFGGVPVMIINTLEDAPPNGASVLSGLLSPVFGFTLSYDEVETGFGVLYDNGKPKPAGCALATLLHGSLHCA